MKFIDTAEIEVAAGRGGDGCIAFRREKGVPRGGPHGGNGGRGGSVILRAAAGSTTLQDFRYQRRYRAANGQPGGGWRRTGADGEDVVVTVPCGTLVYDADTGELLGDLVSPGQELVVAAGGAGGKGNWEFRNARQQAPRVATPGRPGRQRRLRLELKLLADVGLIGLPNAGKSTLLSRLSAARPRIADYPFTTLVPNLGIVDLGDHASCVVADIPGLIEGASRGRGLGHEFLRHVERTRVLAYLVDLGSPAPAAELAVLRQELEAYGHRLPELPFLVVLTKLDAVHPETAARVRDEVAGWARDNGAADLLMISAVTGQGLDSLRHAFRKLLQAAGTSAGE